MPNWCENRVTISASKEVIDNIENVITANEGKDHVLLEHLAPIGEWEYDKAVEKWGTKWDVGIHFHERVDDQTMTLSFDSAWSPPLKAYETWLDSQDSTDVSLTAYYWEPGMCFAGYYENGIDEYYEWDSKESLADVPEYLREEFGIDGWFEDAWEEEDDA